MRKFAPIFLANIFLSLHYAAILYVNSTFLSGFFDRTTVSMLFIGGALLNIVLFLLAPRLLTRAGPRLLYFIFVILTALSLLELAFSQVPTKAAFFFISYIGFQYMIYYCLDLFLESVSLESKTGGTRGLYLTLGNLAIAAGPLLLPLLVTGTAFFPVYAISIGLLVPVLLLGCFFKAVAAEPRAPGHRLPLKAWWAADGARRPTLSRLTLEIFYTVMIIYTPIYLFDIMGFAWSEIGVMFAVMLLPFIFFEWPLGLVADKFAGEKEIMGAGFFIAGIALLTMPFIGPALLAWTAVLFISRMGASFIEISTESHFFKHVDARDSALISIFRLTRPVGTITGALIGILTLEFFSFEKIFFVLAVVILLGLRQSVYLKDTL